MKTIIPILLLSYAITLNAEQAPEDYVEKELKPLGGKILVPKDWHFRGGMTKMGFEYVLSKEDRPDGSYDTGLRIEGVMRVEELTGASPLKSTKLNLKLFKEGSKKIIKECDIEDVGFFKKLCLETIQENPRDPDDNFHIIYSFFWNDDADMMVLSVFGAPESDWHEAEKIYNTIKDYTLIDLEKIKEALKEDQPENQKP